MWMENVKGMNKYTLYDPNEPSKKHRFQALIRYVIFLGTDEYNDEEYSNDWIE